MPFDWLRANGPFVVSSAANAGYVAPALVPITTAEYPLPARRPANSRLSSAKLSATFGLAPAPWEAMLQACMAEIGELREAGNLTREQASRSPFLAAHKARWTSHG